MYFGGLWGGQLEKWQTGEYNPDGKEPAKDEPALGPMVAELNDDMLTFKEKPQEISIVDEDGNPILAGDEDRRYLKVHGCINIMGTITFHILLVLLTISYTL